MDHRKGEYCYVKFTLTKYNCEWKWGILSYTMKNKSYFSPQLLEPIQLYICLKESQSLCLLDRRLDKFYTPGEIFKPFLIGVIKKYKSVNFYLEILIATMNLIC